MKRMNLPVIYILLVLLTMSIPNRVYAQEKLKPKVDLSFFQIEHQTRYLVAKVRTKNGKRFDPVEGAVIKLSANDREVGEVITGKNGEGKLVIPDKIQTSLDSLMQFTFSAQVSSDAKLEAAEKEIDIHQARLTLDTASSDEGKQLAVTIEQRDKNGWAAVSGVEMKIFINRQFGKLPIGEETYTSDDNGKITMDFKSNIPGDKSGKISVGCLVEDNDEFGNLIAIREVGWGTPLVAGHNDFNDRTLWSTRDKTPIWLLVFPNLIIIVVWGLIVYLVLQIVRIVRVGKGTKDESA